VRAEGMVRTSYARRAARVSAQERGCNAPRLVFRGPRWGPEV
jgi:hypothetical protein